VELVRVVHTQALLSKPESQFTGWNLFHRLRRACPLCCQAVALWGQRCQICDWRSSIFNRCGASISGRLLSAPRKRPPWSRFAGFHHLKHLLSPASSFKWGGP